MALRCVKLFVASWLLLGCVGNAVDLDLDKCINLSKELLDSVNATLSSEEINKGFNCTSDLMNDITKATTVIACEPDPSSLKKTECTRQRKTAFDQVTCLRNITEDLLKYKAEFSKYQLKGLSKQLDKTLSKIDALIKSLQGNSIKPEEEVFIVWYGPSHVVKCLEPKARAAIEHNQTIKPSYDASIAIKKVLPSSAKTTFRKKREISFPDRMKLCEVLQAFRVRTVTINRVMNYMKSRH